MSTIRIAHLSDLHFVPGKADAQVWELVRDFINLQVQPHAVLITGDVTDSATQAEFDLARQSLNSLNTREGGDTQRYRIIAGNHDRYLYRGNGPPPGLGWLSRRRWPRDKMSRFDHAFPGALQVTPSSPCDMTLSSPADTGDAGPVNWRIRVVGLDSSAESQWFAQGALSNTNVHVACTAAAKATQHDLVVALVHHHILPIPAVEQRKLQTGGLGKLIDATGLLNAGALMEGLSRAQVDLVLHGHEHAAHQARFTGSDELATSVALIGAGSATGDETLRGWELKRVHFNVIELDDDRSVWLRQVSAESGSLGFRPGRRPILDARDIRVSRFVRRNRDVSETGDTHEQRKLPQSRLRKIIDFRANRDIQLTESRTDWQVNPRWTPVTSSGSGMVGPAIVQFDWADGGRESFVAWPEQSAHEPDRYAFVLERPDANRPRLAARVTARWTWSGAAAFTQPELDMLPQSARGGPRRMGEEFASILSSGEFEELALSVRLPLPFTPPPELVRVYYEDPKDAGVQVYSPEFRGGLEICGPGNFDLRIPYPMPGYRYGLSWPVVAGDFRHPRAMNFARELDEHRAALAHVMSRQIASRGWTDICRWAIYIPQGVPPSALRQTHPNPAAGPDQILLKDARGLARAAFWGDAVVVRADDRDGRYEILQDERLLGYFALRERRELAYQALAVLRIAFTSDPVGEQDEAAWVAEFKAFANLTALTLAAVARGHPVVL